MCQKSDTQKCGSKKFVFCSFETSLPCRLHDRSWAATGEDLLKAQRFRQFILICCGSASLLNAFWEAKEDKVSKVPVTCRGAEAK